MRHRQALRAINLVRGHINDDPASQSISSRAIRKRTVQSRQDRSKTSASPSPIAAHSDDSDHPGAISEMNDGFPTGRKN